LNHFPEPIFPRTISTFKSKGKQFEVFQKEDIIKAYQESDYIDCRINAYPSYTSYKGIQRYPPNFIFADLDRSVLESDQALERALSSALRIIRFRLNGFPTVLWTGNGYHIYQPIDSVILEQYSQYEPFENPSLRFLRFAEQYLTSGKSDPSHNPSFKSCMLRIPGSYNSKYQAGKNMVNIIQKWDGYRPPINLLLDSFYVFLLDQKKKEILLKRRIERKFGFKEGETHALFWIETLLETPIPDFRKNAIGLILAPYLINIRKLEYAAAFQILQNWLDKCNELHGLDANFSYKIKYSLNAAIRKQQLPLKLITLESKNKELYDLLVRKIQKSDNLQHGEIKEKDK
jgi:non-catalytic primase subunit PriX-like protein